VRNATYACIGYHKTVVAIANKHARLVWVLLTRDQALRAPRRNLKPGATANCEDATLRQ
jgi:hypothetical protein